MVLSKFPRLRSGITRAGVFLCSCAILFWAGAHLFVPGFAKKSAAEFGEKIGIAFQLADDVIDIASESHQSGKTPGTDLREGVPTLVTLNVMKSTRPEDRELIELLKAPIKDEAVVAQVLETLRSHHALQESRDQLQQIARDARTALGPLPVNDVTGALFSLCDAIIDRSA